MTAPVQTFTMMDSQSHPLPVAQHMALPPAVLEPAPSPTGGQKRTAVPGPRQGHGQWRNCPREVASSKTPSHPLWSHWTSLAKHKFKDKMMKDFKTVTTEHYTSSLEPFWAGRKCRGNSDAQEVGPKDLAGPPRSLHIVSNPAIQEEIPKAEMTAREPPLCQEVALLNLNLAEDKMTIIMVAQAEESACNVGDPGSTPGSGRCPGEGNGSPL